MLYYLFSDISQVAIQIDAKISREITAYNLKELSHNAKNQHGRIKAPSTVIIQSYSLTIQKEHHESRDKEDVSRN